MQVTCKILPRQQDFKSNKKLHIYYSGFASCPYRHITNNNDKFNNKMSILHTEIHM